MNRRGFLRLLGAGAVAASMPAAVVRALRPRPRLWVMRSRGHRVALWGDGYHDDTAGIQHLLDHAAERVWKEARG